MTRRESGSLFGLTDNGIQLMVRRIGAIAQLPRIHPHAFRHCLIDYWREANATAGIMADLALKMHVGHALPKSDVTTRYQNWSNWQRTRMQAHDAPSVAEMPVV